jgi:beta-glucosidase
VQLKLDEQALMYYNDIRHGWIKEPGTYEILIGNSSRNIQLKGKWIVP